MHQLVPLPPPRPQVGEPGGDSPTGTDTGTDIDERVGAEPRTHRDGRPWVFSNMVTTIDGAATVDGRSAGLGGPGDRSMFSALRAEADVIVVGAQTVRDERYRLVRAPRSVGQRLRSERGQHARARLCIVTRSTELTGGPPLLDELPPSRGTAEPWERPLVATVDHGGEPAFDERFDVLRLGAESVDLVRLVDELGRLGLRRILCEGGPSLLAQFAAAGLVDEWNFTVAPVVAAGAAARPVHSADAVGQRLRLDRVFAHDDGTLFTRYLTEHDSTD